METQKTTKARMPWYVPFSLTLIVVAALITAGLIIASLLRPPTEADAIKAANAAKFARLWGQVAPWLFWLVVAAGVVLFVILARCLANRATETHARAGIYPVKAMRTWNWRRVGRHHLPVQVVVFHDANRAPGPTTVYAAGVPSFHATPNVNPAQLRITQGAQVAQTAAALASGEAGRHPMTPQVRNQIPSINVQAGVDGRQPLLSLPPAQAQMLPVTSSHIERLLREQGDLIPGSIIEEGDSTV